MNFNLNHFTITDETAAKALRDYLIRNNRAVNIERAFLIGMLWVCGRVIFAQHNEIIKLRKETENSEKGD